MSRTEPRIAAHEPAVIELGPGEHWWCRCGRSHQQPLCDGSHSATAIKPLRFELTERKTVALCQCKQTGNAPFCDGEHVNLTR